MRTRSLLTLSALSLACLAVAGCTGAQVDADPMVPTPVDLCTLAAPAGAASEAVVVDGSVGSPATEIGRAHV